MKRREFIQTTLASASLSALPAGPIAASTSAVAVTPGRYAWAVAAAKARNTISADVLALSLKIPVREAGELMTRLEARGVIGAPAATGAARVTAPILRAKGFAGGTTVSTGAGAVRKPLLSGSITRLRKASVALTGNADELKEPSTSEARPQ